MESSSSEFACIGLVVDNNSWRWSTDSSQRYTGRTSVSGGRFVFANQSKDHQVHTAGSIRKVSLQSSLLIELFIYLSVVVVAVASH